ncbi:MAG: Gfo/Idh/MocA family oxidoreductase [Phycisphaerae bacterium]
MFRPTRRTFLKAAAAAAAAPTVVPASVLGKETPSNTLRVGSIGTGRMGHGDMRNALYQGLDESAPARLVAVCDLDLDRARHAKADAEKRYKERDIEATLDVYQDFRKLLARKDIDAVTISTPDHQHALCAVAAADAGKHMYLQKPFTYSVVEGRKLADAVRRNTVVLQTGSQQRSDIRFRKACELVRNGYLGKIHTVEVVNPTDGGRGDPTPMPVPKNLNYDMWLGPTPEAPYTEDRVHPPEGFGRPGWLQIETYSRGMITGWGAHMYDIAQWGLGVDRDGGPVRVSATAKFPDRGLFDVHVQYQAEAEYASGVKLISHSGAAGVKFVGDRGWLWVARGNWKADPEDILRTKLDDDDVRLYESKHHMRNFLECCRTGKDPVAPAEVGHRSNTVCVLHHIAMKYQGKTLTWDPKTERFTGDSTDANAMLDYPHRKPWTV